MILIIFGIAMVPVIPLLIAAWTQPSWIIRVLFTAMAAIPTALFLEQLRFAFPIRWRLNPRWDAFLCRVGSHRCIPICGSRCCWECLRCSPDSPAVKRYFERLARSGIKCPMCKLDAHHGPCQWHPDPRKTGSMEAPRGQ